MILFLVLVISDFSTFLVFRQHYKGFSRTGYYLSMILNAIISCFLWILYIEVKSFKGDFDDPGHVWLMITLTGTICAVTVPRIILNILHFTGKAIRPGKGRHLRLLTNTGIAAWLLIMLTVVMGTLRGRFNFTTEEVEINSEKLSGYNRELTIVHISDLHLAGFYRHKQELEKVMDKINSYNPDIIINSGDFISYGWKEFSNCDTILAAAKARLGKFAVLGNHDIGTYHPDYTASERDTNISRLSDLIKSSGYRLLNNENVVIRDDSITIGIAGIITMGRRLRISYGNLTDASAGLDTVDFTILISHDPNHWDKEVTGKTGIDLTLSGHTHGMQLGIITKWFHLSPSRFFHPQWNGLYVQDGQYLYVNRGLGVLSVPFRIGMPPEITVIRLSGTKNEARQK